MSSEDHIAGKREFLELASSYGVVDAVALDSDTIYVFVASGQSLRRAKEIRELAAEWWDAPRIVLAVRSEQHLRAVRPPSHDVDLHPAK